MQNSFSSDAFFYKQLFERSHTINLIIDFETGQIVEANPAACVFYGYSYEQLTEKHLADINVMPESSIRAVMGRVISGERTTFQTQHRLANGAIVDVEVFASSIERDAKMYLYAIVTDITAQLQSEKALRKQEAIYRLFAQNMPDSSVSMFDTDMRHTLTEGPFLKTFGPLYKSLLGKTPQEALPKALADSIVSVYQRALNGESFNYERITDSYAYESFVAPVHDEDGTIIGGMILSHDITKRHLATVALKDSETRYESVIATMAEGVVVHSQDGIQSCNPAAERILGLTANQLMGRSAMDPRWRAIHEDGSAFPGETHPAMVTLKTGRPLTHVIMGVHKPDDTLAWISINSRPLMRPNETQPYAVVATFVDITERKQLEESLGNREAQLRMIMDNMQDVVTYSDADDIIQYVNPSADNIMGFQATSIIGRSRQDFVHPDDWQSMMAVRQVAINSHQPKFEVEGRVRHADGHAVSVETVGALLYDEGNLYKGGVYITRDISERKRLEDALRESEEQLRIITDHMQELVTQNDNKGRITYVNASAQTMLGYSPDLLFGMASGDLIHPDDRALLGEVFREAVVNRTPQIRFESRLRHADGHYIPVETNGRFITDDQLNPISSVFVTRDISERKHLQEALVKQHTIQAELKKEIELSALKSRMMERIAHEFRTPLTIIQVSMETLTTYYERLTSEKREQKVKIVKSQIRHITDMLDEIGLVVRGSFTPDHLERVSTDLSSLCREIAAELVRYFDRPNIFVLDLPERMMVPVDPVVLGSSIFHVMRNAVRFSDPADAVTVHLSSNEKWVELSVIDQGIGIRPDELPRIFEPFFRGTNINERSGLGVGLAIARAGIEAHGGKITVDSVVEQGTTVKIWLPVS